MTERELDRQAQRRLGVLCHAEEVSGSVAKTCRYYGISRTLFYKWRNRYEEEGLDGLKDRSRRPKTSPTATPTEVVGKVIYLRSNYHFGPQKISMYLARYHEITISTSGVWRILKRLDMNRLPSSQRYTSRAKRWKRYEKPLPGHQLQIDVKFIAPIGGRKRRFYQFTAIDDCTRIRVLRIYDRLNQKTAIQFVDYVLEKLPFVVEKIQTDNGSEFQSQFHWHLLDRGIGHVYIKPAIPAQWEGRAIPPDRRRGVLPPARGSGHRRHKALQRPPGGVGELLQLLEAPRRSRGSDPLRATKTEDDTATSDLA